VTAQKAPWILAIEDSDSDLYLLQRVLDESPGPKRVVRARDGEQAIALIRELAGGVREALPDLIVIDLNMPRVDGFEVLEQLVAQKALSAIPVIVVTSSQQEADRQRAMASGADAYFVKPLEFSRYKELPQIMDQARSARSKKVSAAS
jgi:two-component system, response regulator